MADPARVTFRGLTPYLHYEDAGAMLEWLGRVFGFRERARYVDGEDATREAETMAGETELWMAGHGPGFWEKQARRPDQVIIVWVDDVDAQYTRVTAAGVKADPPKDLPYDVRSFTVTDPEGYKWMFTRRTGKGFEQGAGGLREVRPTRS